MKSETQEKFKKEIELCDAIREDDLPRVKALLKEKVNPQARIDYEDFQTPWDWVYASDNCSIVRSLLKAGADPNLPLDYYLGRTAIFGQVLFQNESIIRLLIANGADINFVDTLGLTPLYFLIRVGEVFLDIMPTLLELGAKITIEEKLYYREFKNNPNLQRKFENHIRNFLTKLEKAYDDERLEGLAADILELSENLDISKDLKDRALKIRGSYCLDYLPQYGICLDYYSGI